MSQSSGGQSLPLYYKDLSLQDMEARLRKNYLTSSGWLESAETKLAVRDGRPIPWFTFSAIRFLEQEITTDLSIFEFGGGQSTVYWAERVRRIVSVDHDPAFVQHVRRNLPPNAELHLLQEGAPVSDRAARMSRAMPRLTDPERDIRTFRSGQLNHAFQGYALKILDYPVDGFDVVVVDGMARVLSTWAAIQHFRAGGFIVFDNSDRDFYQGAYHLLDQAGYRRLDFWGMGPINPYEWCTSVFYQPARFCGTRWFPKPESEKKETKEDLGILVLGFNRPYHLQAVLESLRLQGRISSTHVWLDGSQGRAEYNGQNDLSKKIARRYAIKQLHVMRSHLGIEKMMLDALGEMSDRYERVIVLEDDCFPLENGVELFEKELARIEDRPDVYSVYGHHFGTEPESDQDFTRFQGWGWAAHSDRIKALLPRLRELFLLSEAQYLARVRRLLSDDVEARLDVTPGRDVLKVLHSFFSWDSATAFLSALDGMVHRRTERPAVVNTGIVKGIGHFHDDSSRLRSPPFNMIPLDEAWAHFDTTTHPCDQQKPSYGLDGLDELIIDAVPLEKGFFVELGAYDGVKQSNSVLLERAGWKGLLIEANPGMYAKCVKARPSALVVHAACVSLDCVDTHTTITDVGLMSMTAESNLSGDKREEWIRRGEGFANRRRQDVDVPTATLSGICDEHGISRIDLLLLDVEGSELDVLRGIQFDRHAPRFIVAEDAYDDQVGAFLAGRGYQRTKVLLERRYTRDCFYQLMT